MVKDLRYVTNCLQSDPKTMGLTGTSTDYSYRVLEFQFKIDTAAFVGICYCFSLYHSSRIIL